MFKRHVVSKMQRKLKRKLIRLFAVFSTDYVFSSTIRKRLYLKWIKTATLKHMLKRLNTNSSSNLHEYSF